MKAATSLEFCGIDWVAAETPETEIFDAGFCNLVIAKSFRTLPEPLAFRLLLCCAEGADGDA